MSSSSGKLNSVSLTKKNYDTLKDAADKRGMNVYTLVNALLKDIGIADNEEKLILCLPSHLTKGSKDDLRVWLETRIDKIVDSYYPEKIEC